MLNIKTLEQRDFQGGQVHNIPDNLLPENAVLRLLNLIPGDSAEPLGLRGGFQYWSYGYEYPDDIVAIMPYTAHMVRTSAPHEPFLGDAFLIFFRDVSGNTPVIRVKAVLPPDDVTIPDASYQDACGNTVAIITDNIEWSEFGTDLADDLPVNTEPRPTSPPPYPQIVLKWYDLVDKTNQPSPVYMYPIDYWCDDNGEIDGVDALNNASYWGSEDSDAHLAMAYGEDWNDYYWDIQTGNWNIGDVWTPDEDGVVTAYDIFDTLTTPELRIWHSICFSDETPTSNSGTHPFKNPLAKKPTFISKDIDLEGANRRVYFKFKVGSPGRSAVNVYVRKAGQADTASWGVPVNGASKPLHVVTQASLSNPALRHTDYADGTIGFDYVCPHSSIDIKVEVCVSDQFHANDNNTSVNFVGIEVV